MSISNSIAHLISEMLEEENEIEIQRNIFAQQVGCVPSQINYVLASRFTPEKGYIIKSRRGGGGYIKIVRVQYEKDELLPSIFESIDEQLDQIKAEAYILSLVQNKAITNQEASIFLAAIAQTNFKDLPLPLKDKVRASIFKQMLLALMQK